MGAAGLRGAAAGLGCACALFAAPAAAKPKHQFIPKGTPYAAEVRIDVLGVTVATQTEHAYTLNVCEDAQQTTHQETAVDIRFDARYNQVTVPVAGIRELGDSYKKLHVPPTPTSPGTGGLSHGAWSVSGYGPTDVGEPRCDKQDFSGSGTIPDAGVQPFYELRTFEPIQPGGIAPEMFELYPGALGPASPGTYTDSEGNSQAVDSEISTVLFNTIEDRVEHEGLPYPYVDYGGAALNLPIEDLRKLVHQKRLQLDPVRNDLTSSDCGSTAEGFSSYSCKIDSAMGWQFTLTRHSLYKTKKRYPK